MERGVEAQRGGGREGKYKHPAPRNKESVDPVRLPRYFDKNECKYEVGQTSLFRYSM
jgi:hypothetical protein